MKRCEWITVAVCAALIAAGLWYLHEAHLGRWQTEMKYPFTVERLYLMEAAQVTLPNEEPQMDNPLHQLSFPVRCRCGDGPFANAIEVDEHITEDHLPEAVWDYAYDNMLSEDV